MAVFRRREFMAAMGAGAAALAAPRLSRAETFPSKPVRIVVPYPPGGGTDITARLMAPRLGERWKQTVIIENKAGASGIVGSEVVAHAAPDGYTLMIMTGAHTVNPVTLRKLPYDTERDFTPITTVAASPLAVIGSVKAGMDSMAKLIAAARAEPGKVQFGSSENTTRLGGELFRLRSGLKIENVAYKGAAPMMQELVGGHIPIAFSTPLSTMAHHRAGTARILAIASRKRLPVIADVPTMEEAGIKGVEQMNWFSLFGPGNLPPELARWLQSEFAAVLAEPEILARVRELGAEPGGEPPDVFARQIKAELGMWAAIAKEAGIEPE
ncbi:MAG: tripartite tricarboxylate transporter substrate binding protein [Alphaproteobacteria bacterium]|nr:tripartite tricarboxylate transporter substrate binding protein [Alphaproteobacteria bacterium]